LFSLSCYFQIYHSCPKTFFFFLKSHVWQISGKQGRTRETQIPKFYLVLVFRSSVPVY
jgi:hypothetical protein